MVNLATVLLGGAALGGMAMQIRAGVGDGGIIGGDNQGQTLDARGHGEPGLKEMDHVKANLHAFMTNADATMTTANLGGALNEHQKMPQTKQEKHDKMEAEKNAPKAAQEHDDFAKSLNSPVDFKVQYAELENLLQELFNDEDFAKPDSAFAHEMQNFQPKVQEFSTKWKHVLDESHDKASVATKEQEEAFMRELQQLWTEVPKLPNMEKFQKSAEKVSEKLGHMSEELDKDVEFHKIWEQIQTQFTKGDFDPTYLMPLVTMVLGKFGVEAAKTTPFLAGMEDFLKHVAEILTWLKKIIENFVKNHPQCKAEVFAHSGSAEEKQGGMGAKQKQECASLLVDAVKANSVEKGWMCPEKTPKCCKGWCATDCSDTAKNGQSQNGSCKMSWLDMKQVPAKADNQKN